MTEQPQSPEWRAVACTECRKLEGDYCHGWGRQVGPPLDKRVRICKRYEPRKARGPGKGG